MTQLKRHARLPVLSAACSLAVVALAAAAIGDDRTSAITGEHAGTAIIRADNRNAAAGQNGAGFNLTDYYRWREDIALPPLADDGDDRNAAKGASAVNPSHHRRGDNNFAMREILDFRALAAGVVNHGGDSIADWRKRTQMKLFSSLEDELARRGEEALLFHFTELKRSQIHLQTELGGRKGHVGAALVGVIAEQPDSALGWQLRIFGGQESSKGFNAGIFYRRINGDTLIGGNLFADYEDQKSGNFIRYSIGGDLQHRFVSFAANYYVPITGEKRTQTGEYAFSRQGYDIRARLSIPQTRYVRAAVDYYNFDGGRRELAQQGIRYGAELFHFPLPGLRVGLFYDADGEQLGSEFAYNHTFGEEPETPPIDSETPPLDLFAPVDREHTQRIAVSPAPIAVNLIINSDLSVENNIRMVSVSSDGVVTQGVRMTVFRNDDGARVLLGTLTARGGRVGHVYLDKREDGISGVGDIGLEHTIPMDTSRRVLFLGNRSINVSTYNETIVVTDRYRQAPQVSLLITVVVTAQTSDASESFLLPAEPADKADENILAQSGLFRLPYRADAANANAFAGYDDKQIGGYLRQMPPMTHIRYRPSTKG